LEIPTSPPTALKPEEAYARRFSVWQRLLRLTINPSEAIKDIALAPEYDGVTVIIVAQLVLLGVGFSLIGKCSFTTEFAVFFVLSLIGLLVSFVSNP
jgi:hypothetical protein